MKLSYDAKLLGELCQAYNVKRLAVFGSVLRGEDKPASDLDLLVEFEGPRTPGLRFFRLERELSAIFGHRVDLNTPNFLSPYYRDEVRASARNIYAA
jgi:predicted nucleotidyltransferase